MMKYTQTSTLASMEQQLRAGIRPTIPSSAEARATLARSLPDLRPATGVPRAVIRVVDMGPAPIPRKRKSYKRREKSDVLDGKKKAGVSRWVVATDWPFSEKALKGMAFAKEIWMMMTAFGELFCSLLRPVAVSDTVSKLFLLFRFPFDTLAKITVRHIPQNHGSLYFFF